MGIQTVTAIGMEMGTGMGMRTGAGTVGNENKFNAEPGGTSPALEPLELVRDQHCPSWSRGAAPPARLSRSSHLH